MPSDAQASTQASLRGVAHEPACVRHERTDVTGDGKGESARKRCTLSSAHSQPRATRTRLRTWTSRDACRHMSLHTAQQRPDGCRRARKCHRPAHSAGTVAGACRTNLRSEVWSRGHQNGSHPTECHSIAYKRERRAPVSVHHERALATVRCTRAGLQSASEARSMPVRRREQAQQLANQSAERAQRAKSGRARRHTSSVTACALCKGQAVAIGPATGERAPSSKRRQRVVLEQHRRRAAGTDDEARHHFRASGGVRAEGRRGGAATPTSLAGFGERCFIKVPFIK